MARDNFIIHSKKYFSFAMPSTPASISISAYGWIAKYISRWRAIHEILGAYRNCAQFPQTHTATIGGPYQHRSIILHSMLLSLSQFESFENRRSEMASSSLHSQKSGGTNLIGGVSSIYIFAWKRSSRVLSLLRSQFWVLRFGFSVLGSRTGRDVRKLEIEEHKSHRETQTHTHTHTLVKGSPGWDSGDSGTRRGS